MSDTSEVWRRLLTRLDTGCERDPCRICCWTCEEKWKCFNIRKTSLFTCSKGTFFCLIVYAELKEELERLKGK